MAFRKVTEEDREIIRQQIELEPFHKDQGFKPDQFFEKDTFSICFSDDKGDIAYMVVKKVAHCHIQWVRTEGEHPEIFKERIRERLTEELPWVMQLLKGNGYKACVYDTKNPGLAWFLRRFGFRTLKDWFINWL